MQGWIQLHRQMMEWERYNVPHMVGFWVHLLLKTNHVDKKWRGILIKRGQFISSLDNLVSETGLSKQTVRTLISKLKSTHEITYQSTHSYTLFNIVKYDDYQEKPETKNKATNTPDNTPPTDDQHTTNTPLTPTNNDNNNNNDNKDENTTIVVEPPAETPAVPTPTEYGDPNINKIISIIKKYNNGICDGTVADQRKYGKNLFNKLKKIESVVLGKYTPFSVLEYILAIISNNQYHSHKIAGPQVIFDELTALMQVCKQEFAKKEKAQPKKAKTF